MSDQFFPIDIVMWIINICRGKCCGESNTCNMVFLGLRMVSHFISAILEFIMLNVSNLEYARYDSHATGLFGWIIVMICFMPACYCGSLGDAMDDFKCGSWSFKGYSIVFDIFFISYTIYITKVLQGELGNIATLIVIDIGLEFTSCFVVVVYFMLCCVVNEVAPS